MVAACGASTVSPEIAAYEEPGEAADLGSKVHDELASFVDDNENATPSDDTSFLFWCGVKAWRQLSPEFPCPITEVSMSHKFETLYLTGHADVASIVGTEIRILDWKSGFKDSDYAAQMVGYCAAALGMYPELETATATIVWLRTGDIERYSMARHDLPEWETETVAEANPNRFAPGSHCDYCHRSHECPSRNALARRDMATILGTSVADVASIALLPDDSIVELLSKAKMAAACAKRIHDAIKAHVERVGKVEGDRSSLTITTQDKRKLDPLKAWPVLTEEGFEDEDFAGCVTMSASSVDGIVAKKAGKGNGKKAIAALRDKLTEAGAISTTTIGVLTERRN